MYITKISSITHVPGLMGVRVRRSDDRLIKAKLGWELTEKLILGIEKTYAWIEKKLFQNSKSNAHQAMSKLDS